ncbi:MAG: hypothetical protein AB1498_04235 [bacterium]
MKKIFLIFICVSLIGCAGSNYGANGTLKGKILRPGYAPPGSNNTDTEVVIEGKSGYKGPSLRAPINPNDGNFEIDINLGTEDLGPPVVYVNSATFDLKLKVNGIWWVSDTTSAEAVPFWTNVIVESGKTTDIGTLILDWPGIVSMWK